MLNILEVIVAYTTYAELHLALQHTEGDPAFIRAPARVDKKMVRQNVK